MRVYDEYFVGKEEKKVKTKLYRHYRSLEVH